MFFKDNMTHFQIDNRLHEDSFLSEDSFKPSAKQLLSGYDNLNNVNFI